MAADIALVFAWGGMKMVMSAGNTEGVSEAKGMMTNAVIGFIILLAAWLIINTILVAVVSKEDGIQKWLGEGKWNQIECVAPPTRTTTPGGGVTTPPSGTTQPGSVGIGQLSHADALVKLNGIHITSSSGDGGVVASCPTGNGCTSLQGMREQTVQQVLNIDTECPRCDITVIGGTEGGHSETATGHSAGYKVDIVGTQPVDTFLKSKLTENGVRGGANGGPRFLDKCGNEYVRESTHWDVQVSNGSCGI